MERALSTPDMDSVVRSIGNSFILIAFFNKLFYIKSTILFQSAYLTTIGDKPVN